MLFLTRSPIREAVADKPHCDNFFRSVPQIYVLTVKSSTPTIRFVLGFGGGQVGCEYLVRRLLLRAGPHKIWHRSPCNPPRSACRSEPVACFRRFDIGGGVGRQQQALGDECFGRRSDLGNIGLAAAVALFERWARVTSRLALGSGPGERDQASRRGRRARRAAPGRHSTRYRCRAAPRSAASRMPAISLPSVSTAHTRAP